MENLHSGARWLFRLNAYSRFGFIFIFAVYFMFISILNKVANGAFDNTILILFGLIIFVLIVAEIYARMSYNRYLYEIKQDAVKIEKGIIWKKYTSIPYERIQNVDLRRGIIARMFGFSTVEIETAGQSGYGGSYSFRFGRRGNRRYQSEGHLPAIDINGAEKIRQFVMKRVKQTHGSGL